MVAAASTRVEPDNIGLASIIGKSSPVGPHDPFGAWVVFRPGGRDVFAPIAPGLFKPVGLAEVSRLALGEEKEVTIKPLTEGGSASADQAAHLVIALDGEREVDLSDGDQISIRLDDQGPLVVDVKAALAGAVAAGFFTDRKFMNQFND